MVKSETVVCLVVCPHPQEKVFPIAQVGILGASDYCSACGAWRDEGKQDWTRPELVEAIALEGVQTMPRPPKAEASTFEVPHVSTRAQGMEARLEATGNVDGTVTVVLHGDHGMHAWRYVTNMEAAEYARALLQAAGASTDGIPTPDAFGEHSAGRPEPEALPPLGGVVNAAIGATMRPTFLLGWLRGVVDMALEATPGDELAAALQGLRRVSVVVDQTLAGDDEAGELASNGEASAP